MPCPTNAIAIAAAIWQLEGGQNTRWPYGIKSVQTSDPRVVCLRTVTNNAARWERAGRPGCFLNFLADRYCPAAHDPTGNQNWKRNAARLLNHPSHR